MGLPWHSLEVENNAEGIEEKEWIADEYVFELHPGGYHDWFYIPFSSDSTVHS